MQKRNVRKEGTQRSSTPKLRAHLEKMKTDYIFCSPKKTKLCAMKQASRRDSEENISNQSSVSLPQEIYKNMSFSGTSKDSYIIGSDGKKEDGCCGKEQRRGSAKNCEQKKKRSRRQVISLTEKRWKAQRKYKKHGKLC